MRERAEMSLETPSPSGDGGEKECAGRLRVGRPPCRAIRTSRPPGLRGGGCAPGRGGQAARRPEARRKEGSRDHVSSRVSRGARAGRHRHGQDVVHQNGGAGIDRPEACRPGLPLVAAEVNGDLASRAVGLRAGVDGGDDVPRAVRLFSGTCHALTRYVPGGTSAMSNDPFFCDTAK